LGNSTECDNPVKFIGQLYLGWYAIKFGIKLAVAMFLLAPFLYSTAYILLSRPTYQQFVQQANVWFAESDGAFNHDADIKEALETTMNKVDAECTAAQTDSHCHVWTGYIILTILGFIAAIIAIICILRFFLLKHKVTLMLWITWCVLYVIQLDKAIGGHWYEAGNGIYLFSVNTNSTFWYGINYFIMAVMGAHIIYTLLGPDRGKRIVLSPLMYDWWHKGDYPTKAEIKEHRGNVAEASFYKHHFLLKRFNKLVIDLQYGHNETGTLKGNENYTLIGTGRRDPFNLSGYKEGDDD
jgi:hypothetical protein